MKQLQVYLSGTVTLLRMLETFDSVIDRVGAFNEATEKMSKGRASSVECLVKNEPSRGLRLIKTDEYYRFEVSGAIAPEKTALMAEMKFSAVGPIYARDVRRVERSWNVASQMEDILGDVFGLPPDTAVTVDIV